MSIENPLSVRELLGAGDEEVESASSEPPPPGSEERKVAGLLCAELLPNEENCTGSNPGRAMSDPAAQARPEVPAGAEVAAVLAELLDKIEEMQHTDWVINCDGPLFKRARAALKAATGARAAGGELTFGEEYWRGHGVGRCEEREHYLSSGSTEQDRADLTELIRNGLLEDDGIGAQFRRTDDGLPADLARWIVDAGWSKSAAPPTPSAPRVAELLAECRWRLDEGVGQPFMPSEIVRWLTPGGTDGGES